MDVEYIYFALGQITPEIETRASGTTFKEISATAFSDTLLGIPPFKEQVKIKDAIIKVNSELTLFFQ